MYDHTVAVWRQAKLSLRLHLRRSAPRAAVGPLLRRHPSITSRSGAVTALENKHLTPIDTLLAVMVKLRDPQTGCPWDLEQDFDSIAPHTIEEAYEVAEAISRRNMPDLCDELGDLLFQVVFYAQMASEAEAFNFDDVVAAIVDKMVRRHPHVFGEERIDDAQTQTLAWEQHKASERRAKGEAPESRLDSIGSGLPALSRALKLQRKASQVGLDWPNASAVLVKLDEESRELEAALDDGAPAGALADELGDLMFTCVNIARHLGVDCEGALRRANLKFERRFRVLEALAEGAGGQLCGKSPEELDALWRRSKAALAEANGEPREE